MFVMDEVTTTRGYRNTHSFANFRTKAGKWFKVRIKMVDLPDFDSMIPEASRGKSILGRIDTDPRA